MSALRRAFHPFALLFVATLAPACVTAQTYAYPQTVYLPPGQAQVARVTSVATILRHFTAADLEMKSGDLIFAMDGIAIDSAEHFNAEFEKKTDGAVVRIDFLRNGVVHQSFGPLFRFTRGVFKSDKPHWGGGLDTTTADFTPSLLEKPVVRSVTVLELSHVSGKSAAGNAGLQKGDLLLSVNGRTIGRASRSDIIIPLFPEGTPLHFEYLREGQRRSGDAPLTLVKTGLTKFLSFGFSGESRMADIASDDKPERLPHDVQMETPAS